MATIGVEELADSTIPENDLVGEMADHSRPDARPAPVLVALLVAEACNVGLVPVIKDGDEALTRGRLSHVDQNCATPSTSSTA